MSFFLNEKKVAIAYSAKFREYYIELNNGTDAVQLINYCPWCGSKLPEVLGNVFFETLEKEYNIEADLELKNIPHEFQSDEWWKKRGL